MENSEVGKIIISKNKKQQFIFQVALAGKQPMTIPAGHSLKDDSLNGKECNVFREKGQIQKIIVDGNDILESRSVPIPTQKANPHNNSSTQKGTSVDSFDISKTQIPKDTREALKDFKEIDNFHLKLNKYARFENEKPVFFKATKGKVDFSIIANFGDFPFEDNIDKQEQVAKALFGKNYYSDDLKTPYRLLIGGEASIYETSIRLHHIYGIPYIPASAIKGVVRSYIITEKFGSNEEEALNDKDFKKVFGSTDQEGKVTFFDAFPTATPTEPLKLKVDIMNPHYGDYYNKKQPPTDTQSPNPINFLTVEDTTFRFIVGAKESLGGLTIKDKTIDKWLKEALQNHGIGAKTAVGYGYFD